MVERDDEVERPGPVMRRDGQSTVVTHQSAERELREAKKNLELRNEELRGQREWVEITLSSIGDAVITTDTAARVTFMNPIAEAITGWSRTEAEGLEIGEIFQIVDELTGRTAENPVSEVLRQGKAVVTANPTSLIAKDGTETAIEDRAGPIRANSGRIVGAVMVFRDVTEKRRAAEALHEESRALEILNRTGAMITAQLDLETVVQTVTDAATELSGAEFGAFFYNITDDGGGAFMLYTLSGADRAQFERFGHPRATPLFAPTFRGDAPIRLDDVRDDPRYGQWAPHFGMPKGHLPVRSYLAVPVTSRSGEVHGGLFFGHSVAGIFTERVERIITGIAAQAAIAIDNARLYDAAQREIESRERAQHALRRADRRKDDFLATLAHELRNPLAPILQAAKIWKLPDVTAAQIRWSHDVIERQARHMSLLLDDLLDVSRITRGKLELRKERLNVEDVIDVALETARPLIDARRHALTLDLPPEPLSLNADPLRLAQVLANLLTNAAKYTEPGGLITLSARSSDDEISISVTDSGIGIAADALPQIFKMFSQTTSVIDRASGGLGIGLALVKGLVSLHGGRVVAASDGPGRGSKFSVHLPIGARPQDDDSSAKLPDAAQTAQTSRRVLLADDNRDMADSLAMFLRLRGHEVEVVYDGEAAVQAFEALGPDFVVLDIGMPKLNGYQTAKRIRKICEHRSVTLVALTGWGQDNDKRRARDAGFDHHFTKPLDPEVLAGML